MPAEAEQYAFTPGTYLGDRFRIVRPVGRGGMGVVYEAIDQKLDRRVALKCARPGFRYRLPPEARAAREVSHFNVCKVHELHVVSTPFGETDCLSMEFIEGETLAVRIRRTGPLSGRAARDIALQLCAGLAQAHRQKVVHGDLKCGNVILGLSPERRLRAVITDFGLARMGDAAANSEESGGGTLDYMAPEQLLGEPASAASDIHALGVLFHVMLTGAPPARLSEVSAREPAEKPSAGSQHSTVTLRHAICEEDWRRRVGPLPRPWKKIVTRCLAPLPERRYASAGALAAAVDPRRTALKWAAALVAVAILAIGARQWRTPPPVTPVRLAVLPIEVEGEPFANAARIGLELTDRLTGMRRKFTVISPREAERNRVTTAAMAGAALGATHVLETHIRVSGGTLAAEATLLDLQSGRRMGRLSGTYPARDAPALSKALLATVTGAFELPQTGPEESVAAAAYPYYLEAMDLLRQDGLRNADRAVPLFTRASALDPQSALPYAGLAEAQLQRFIRGDGPEWLELAAASAAKARGLNADSAQVLLASGSIEQQHGSYEQAIRQFTRAAELAPEDSETWRRLAACYDEANRPDEAIATYRKAIDAQPNYYRQYIGFGTFYFNRGQFQRAEEQYRRVTAIAPGLASGHMNLGLAFMQEGRFAEAEAELLHALELGESRNLLLNIGGLYYEEERFADAARYFEKSLSVATPSALLYRDLGDAYRHLGETREAAAAYRHGAALAREDIARNPRRADARSLLALISAFLNNRKDAEFEISQALAMAPESRPVLRDATIVYEAFGQREKALAALRSAPRRLLEELNRQPDVRDLRKDPAFQDLLRNKAAE